MKRIQTIILCGGLGTRLREETEYRPKPMVPIGGRPILWHIMKIYANFGFSEFILPLGYKGSMIKEYFYHYHMMNSDICIRLGKNHSISFFPCDSDEDENWSITLVNTGEKTLKGARLKRVEKYIDCDQVMVTYGDGVADIDIKKLVEFHNAHGKMATVTGVSPASQFGEMQVRDNRVLHFREKPISSNQFISGGFFVFNRSFFSYLEENDSCDLETGPLERIAHEGELMIYKHPGSWACMDTIRDTDYLNGLWDQNKAFWKIWK
jgi:glucose-1-phosphate cytidylyltransferase